MLRLLGVCGGLLVLALSLGGCSEAATNPEHGVAGNDLGPASGAESGAEGQGDDAEESSDIVVSPGEPDTTVADAWPSQRPIPAPTFSKSKGRVVAMGDVHGDIDALRRAMGLAGLINEDGQWVGGETVLVQVGDQLDRGDSEKAILEWLEELADQAHAAGGAVHVVLGNHETMNVQRDYRYVTDGGWLDFSDIDYPEDDPELLGYPADQRGRVAAFRPGGAFAQLLAGHNMVVVVDDTVFVHGGVLPAHVSYGLEVLNAEVQAWMFGDAGEPTSWTRGDDCPVWSRHYSADVDPADCELLREALDGVPASRMVVGHTVQSQINEACDGLVWRVDVGMAQHYGGRASVLQIIGDEVTVLP